MQREIFSSCVCVCAREQPPLARLTRLVLKEDDDDLIEFIRLRCMVNDVTAPMGRWVWLTVLNLGRGSLMFGAGGWRVRMYVFLLIYCAHRLKAHLNGL